MAKPQSKPQLSLDVAAVTDDAAGLGPDHWSRHFFAHIFTAFDDGQFADMYEEGGRCPISPRLLACVTILQYLFQFGRFPPYPGPGLDRATGASTPMGPDCTLVDPADPTSECIPDDDDLDCKDGGAC